jgi:hypothetical protein
MFTLQYAKDPFYNNEEGTAIHLTVKWEEFVEEMPFGACSYDPEPHGVDLYNRAQAGEFGPVAAFTAPVVPSIDFQPTSTGTQSL